MRIARDGRKRTGSGVYAVGRNIVGVLVRNVCELPGGGTVKRDNRGIGAGRKGTARDGGERAAGVIDFDDYRSDQRFQDLLRRVHLLH